MEHTAASYEPDFLLIESGTVRDQTAYHLIPRGSSLSCFPADIRIGQPPQFCLQRCLIRHERLQQGRYIHLPIVLYLQYS